MANRKKQRSRGELWDGEDFEDINSHSNGERPQYEWFVQRQKLNEEARAAARKQAGTEERPAAKGKGNRKQKKGTKAEKSRKKPAKQGSRQPTGRREPNNRREPVQRSGSQARKRKKPMSLFKRRLLIVLGIFAMLTLTLFLAESLLLRVTDVRVEGDMVYPQEDILNICKFRTGDNMLLLPVGDREDKLVSQLPYVAKAKITRRLPGTVVITITAAQPGCCIETGGAWLVVSGSGKILVSQPQPQENLLQVTGFSPRSAQPGDTVEAEDENVSQAFRQIVEKVASLGASQDFTRLDLTDLSNIRLWYQERVECVLGNTAELDYKIQYAYDLFQNEQDRGIGPEENGSLDLSFLPDNKTSYFTAGENSPPKQARYTPTPSPSPSQEPVSSEESQEDPYEPEEEGGEDWVEPEGGEDWVEPEENGEDWADPEEGGEDWVEPEDGGDWADPEGGEE